jgi:hypothetical protein
MLWELDETVLSEAHGKQEYGPLASGLVSVWRQRTALCLRFSSWHPEDATSVWRVSLRLELPFWGVCELSEEDWLLRSPRELAGAGVSSPKVPRSPRTRFRSCPSLHRLLSRMGYHSGLEASRHQRTNAGLPTRMLPRPGPRVLQRHVLGHGDSPHQGFSF